MLRNPPEVNIMLDLNNPMCEAFPRVSFFLERFFRTVSWRSYYLYFVLFFQHQKGLQTSPTFFLQKKWYINIKSRIQIQGFFFTRRPFHISIAWTNWNQDVAHTNFLGHHCQTNCTLNGHVDNNKRLALCFLTNSSPMNFSIIGATFLFWVDVLNDEIYKYNPGGKLSIPPVWFCGLAAKSQRSLHPHSQHPCW